jgi:glycosyltransferase involved in cell wall biosynthesis
VRVVKVSVVIPLYNARDVIAETIESVLAQTWTDYEIIVVDDGSQDGSGELVQAFGDRVRYIWQENTGVAGARNRGIEESHGEYIALLDHDDLWDPTKLEKQVRMLEQNPEIGMVLTDVGHIDKYGNPMSLLSRGYNPAETFARLFVQGYVPTPSSMMIRRSVFLTVGGFDEAFHSAGLDDHELWPRIAAQYPLANLPEPLTYHRNDTGKPPRIALAHRTVLIDKLLHQFGDDPIKSRYLFGERGMWLADYGKQLIKEGDRDAGRALLVQGLAFGLKTRVSVKMVWRCLSRLARSYIGLCR